MKISNSRNHKTIKYIQIKKPKKNTYEIHKTIKYIYRNKGKLDQFSYILMLRRLLGNFLHQKY